VAAKREAKLPVVGAGNAFHERKRWGRWVYDRRNQVLEHDPNRWYWIPVQDGKTPELIGRCMLHLSNKRWITSDDLGCLVRAFRDLHGHWTW
jgi:hypothetical protein